MRTGTKLDRAVQLLTLAADELARHNDPINPAWLAEHEVTLDECYALDEHLALGATLLAWLISHPKQARAVARGAGMESVGSALLAAARKWQPEGAEGEGDVEG